MTGPERRSLYARADDLFRELEILNLAARHDTGLRLPAKVQRRLEALAADLQAKKRVPVYSGPAHSFLMDALEVLVVDIDAPAPLPSIAHSTRQTEGSRPDLAHRLSDDERAAAERERAFDRWALAHGCFRMLVLSGRSADEIAAARRDLEAAWDAYRALSEQAA